MVHFRPDTTSAKTCTDKLDQLNRHTVAQECSELYQRTMTIFSYNLLFKISFPKKTLVFTYAKLLGLLLPVFYSVGHGRLQGWLLVVQHISLLA